MTDLFLVLRGKNGVCYIGAVCFSAGKVRQAGFKVGYDPISKGTGYEENSYHGEVWGDGLFNKRQQRSLMAICEWFVPIEGVAISK